MFFSKNIKLSLKNETLNHQGGFPIFRRPLVGYFENNGSSEIHPTLSFVTTYSGGIHRGPI